MKLFLSVINNIISTDEEAKIKAKARLDSLAKPLGSLGKLEDIAIQLAGISGEVFNEIDRACIVVMCADNGVVDEGVSSCPKYITKTQTINFIKGVTGIGVLARHEKMDIRVVDIGIDGEISYPGLVDKKIRNGTYNMAKGPAMTREEAIEAIEIGIDQIKDLVDKGYKLIGTGEMGIGNTSTSSAILMALTGCSVNFAVGKGAGLTEEGLKNKKRVISKALEINKPDKNDAIDILSKVGGFDIAGIVGCFLGAAYYRVPIIIDGFISAAAALIAYKLNPIVREFMIPSHNSLEPGFQYIMEELNLSPIFNLNMRLGEGTGCPLAYNIIKAATSVITNMATFEEAEIVDDYLIDIRKD